MSFFLHKKQLLLEKFLRFISQKPATDGLWSRDDHPWAHPSLTNEGLSRFRAYSESVWSYALEYANGNQRKLNCAFSVNMAQNMYKWARLAQDYGADATLFLHAHDSSAISKPQWEDFDGEYPDVHDGAGFLAKAADLVPAVPCREILIESPQFCSAITKFANRNRLGSNTRDLLSMLHQSERMRLEVLEFYPQFRAYFDWAKELSEFDVIYTASAPFAAYASGRPYCLLSVGGDLQFDCGRGDWFGRAMTQAFNTGRFSMVTNPHAMGHMRRLGLTNGIYLPYLMDTNRYCPGVGTARARWESKFGPGVYVLTTARIDSGVKGHNETFFGMLKDLAQKRSELRFIFLAWGHGAEKFKERIDAEGLQKQLIILSPVGKKRLIDYYRSCDVVLDQFVYGYYGATALEAAAIGKPVIMKIRAEQYAPLYVGDVAPVMNATSPSEIHQAILALADDPSLRERQGAAMRAWVARNHGEEKITPLMLALLRLAADRAPLPSDIVNPLLESESDEEVAYHNACLRPAPLSV